MDLNQKRIRRDQKRTKRESDENQKRTKREPDETKREFILHRDTSMVDLVKHDERFELVSKGLDFVSESILS